MRLFLATRLDDQAASRLAGSFSSTRSRTARASWVKPDAYHVTYAFLGEQPEAVANRIADALPAVTSDLSAWKGVLSGAGFFPDERRPRVGWIAFVPPEGLNLIARTVRQMLDGLPVSYDRKPFRPHLTIVRIRDRWAQKDVTEFTHAAETMGQIELELRRISLFRSELRPDGARHEELAAATLERR